MLSFKKKFVEFLIDCEDLQKTLTIISEADPRAACTVGNCGWKKAPNCWFVHFKADDFAFNKIMLNLGKQDITLYDDSIGQ